MASLFSLKTEISNMSQVGLRLYSVTAPKTVDINHLRPSGNYMNHLLWQSVMLQFVFIGFVWFSL
jgi:hypothetical protein